MAKDYEVIAPDRYLHIRTAEARVSVHWNGRLVAASEEAVLLAEGERSDVAYLPRDEIAPATLVASETEYHCRWKGDASYFDVELGGEVARDGAWAYLDAPEDVDTLRDRVAFDSSVFEIRVSVPTD